MSAADEALRVLIVQRELLDERAAGHVYRQSIAAGKTLDLFLLDEKILDPDDIVSVVEERQKLALACRRCKHVTYLLHGQVADALICVRCKEPFSGKRRTRPTDSAFQVVSARRSKLPAVIGLLLFAAAGGGLYYAYQQKVAARTVPPPADGGAGTETPGDETPAGPGSSNGDRIEIEVLVAELVKAEGSGDWRRQFDCFATRYQVRMVQEAVQQARKAVTENPSLDAEWKDICGDAHYWVYAKSTDEQDLSLKLSMKLSTNEQRQLYDEIQKLLKAEPVPNASRALKDLRVSERTAKARIVTGESEELRVEFVLEDEEWRINRLWS